MAKSVKKSNESRKMRPAFTPEARENQIINAAVNLAAQQIEDGTASSQVITHFLKLASTKSRLELEKIEQENQLLRAKTEALRSQKVSEELYKDAMDAFKLYNGEDVYYEDE